MDVDDMTLCQSKNALMIICVGTNRFLQEFHIFTFFIL